MRKISLVLCLMIFASLSFGFRRTDIVANGDFQVGKFFTVDFSNTAYASSANSGVITPIGSFQNIDTYDNGSVSTVNYITTHNIEIGTIIYFSTIVATHDVVFSSGGNISISSDVTLGNPDDIIAFIKKESNKYIKLFSSINE